VRSKSGDYDNDMNHANYKKCLQEKLIPNLESKSVNVVDSESYHNARLNRHPTINARKGEMLFWFDKHGIRYSSDVTKAELYDLIKMNNRNMRLLQLIARRTWAHGSDYLLTILI
jgi:hypothetical protein